MLDTVAKKASGAEPPDGERIADLADQLARSADALRDLTDIAQVGAWTVSVPSMELDLSPKVLEILEVDPDSVEFGRMLQLYADESRELIETALDAAIDAGVPWDVEVPTETGAGREIWVRIIGRPVVEGGMTVRVTGAIQDVTERRRADEARRKLDERMVEAARLESLGLLAGGIAHDFNNLLAVIINYAAFVSERVDAAAAAPGGETWEEAASDLIEVQQAARRAADLTRQMLTFARREVAQLKVLDLNRVVGDLVSLLERTVGESIQVSTSLSTVLWNVNADPGQVEQVLMNLVLNARDAMPAGGELRIDTANVDADLPYLEGYPGVTPGRYVRLRVSDTGIGMDDETRRHALEPFFTTKPHHIGTGLGLASVHGIVTQAGGGVQLYSEVGAGTTVGVLLPGTDAQATPVPAPPAEQKVGGHETVLMVEDEAALAEVTRRVLTRNGYTLLSASSGDEAIEVAAQHDGTIDLLLTDVVLPGMSGRDVAEKLAVARPGIRVVFMSGYARPVLASRGALDAGVRLVEKPFSEAVLLTNVRAALDGDPAR
jgi:hypothetical protein